MLIKFKASDPRAGAVVCMDSSRGQYFIDAGAAVAVAENESGSAPLPPTGSGKTPTGGAELTDGQKFVAAPAADVITAVEALADADLLQAGLTAEQAGKKRKTVLDALNARLAAVKV